MRVGIGYDVHPLTRGRRLVLGGVEVPFDRGLDGHSDADVLLHAMMDALLGAAGLGDIGTHFPPSDPEYRDISSVILLGNTVRLLHGHGWRVINVDATIVAEQPRLSPFVPQMRRVISEALEISPDCVGVKCTTTDGLGFAGRGEGIAAQAVALLERAVGEDKE